MIKVRALIDLGDGKEYEDVLKVSSMETAQADIEAILERFNQEECQLYGDDVKQRKLIRIIEDTGFRSHDWRKVNLVGQRDRRGIYDLYECTSCLMKYKRYGLGGGLLVTDCYPGQVCTKCNWTFKTKDSLIKHNQRKHGVPISVHRPRVVGQNHEDEE